MNRLSDVGQARRALLLLLVCISTLLLARRVRESSTDDSTIDAIVVLAGGVDDSGRPHESVLRRLRKAVILHQEQLHAGRTVPIICNGGGTTHKPKFVDPAGYAVPEAALMARELQSLGVAAEHILLEGYSDDTLGNAFFLRTMHADTRTDWERLAIVTSEFQMERTKEIYSWVFGLLPMPRGKQAYLLSFHAVDDNGALPDKALEQRRDKESASVRAFRTGSLAQMRRLDQVHHWLFTQHSAYTATGMLSKKALSHNSALKDTY